MIYSFSDYVGYDRKFKEANKYPEMVKEIHNRGFEIGIHSNTHPDMTKLTRRQIKEELEINIKKIKSCCFLTACPYSANASQCRLLHQPT